MSVHLKVSACILWMKVIWDIDLGTLITDCLEKGFLFLFTYLFRNEQKFINAP